MTIADRTALVTGDKGEEDIFPDPMVAPLRRS
jgi:hypothetical protein